MAAVVAASAGLLRAVPSGSEHLTLVFLGDRERPVEEVVAALAPLGERRRFAMRLGGARVFAGRGRPRLVSLDVAWGGEEVSALAEEVRSLLTPLFPDLDDYRLKPPHVTLMRFRRSARRRDGRRVEEELVRHSLASWTASETVATVDLIRSELTSSGARYSTVGEIGLCDEKGK